MATLILTENFELIELDDTNTGCHCGDTTTNGQINMINDARQLEERIDHFLCDLGVFICDPKDKQREYFDHTRSSVHRKSDLSKDGGDSPILSQVSRSSILSRRKMKFDLSIGDDIGKSSSLLDTAPSGGRMTVGHERKKATKSSFNHLQLKID